MNPGGSILCYSVFKVLLFREDFLDRAFYGKAIHETPELF